MDPAAKDELGGLWMGSTGLYPGFLFFFVFPNRFTEACIRTASVNND